MAVAPPEGMPSVSIGKKAPLESALLAPSGAARPSGAPWPNISGRLETAFSMPYDTKEEIEEDAPGKVPMKNPTTEPFRNAKRQALISSQLGR